MSLLLIIFLVAALVLATAMLTRTGHTYPGTEQVEQEILKLDQLLPQTQCGDCGYVGCRPYAEAIVKDMEDINRCLPGGEHTVKLLAEQTGRVIKPLYKDSTKSEQVKLAVIDEATCIGCVKCIRACPVDAIIGAPKLMHSVINKYCTGCELCIPPCPVDCISMVEVN